ncbi:MAG: hypothetical protein WC435_01010 [Candidatus Paceibacterota bacterium]
MTELFIICVLLVLISISKHPFAWLASFYQKLVEFERSQIGFGRNEKKNNRKTKNSIY